MIAVSARASGSVITEITNRAADKLIKIAQPHITATIVASLETGLRNSKVIVIIRGTDFGLFALIPVMDRLQSVQFDLRSFGLVPAFLVTVFFIAVAAGY